MDKRLWCYVQPPHVYEVYCDKCLGSNTTWSGYESLIWCFDCEIDTKGTEGAFNGPIPLETAKLLGMSFDRIRLKDNEVIKVEDYLDKDFDWS